VTSLEKPQDNLSNVPLFLNRCKPSKFSISNIQYNQDLHSKIPVANGGVIPSHKFAYEPGTEDTLLIKKRVRYWH
jgi:hypothetical protein